MPWSHNPTEALPQPQTLAAGNRILSLEKPLVMGILNLTPDSFYSGSRLPSVEAALQQAEQMLAEGAAILDVGGYSSRPQATDIAPEEELQRVIPVIDALRVRFPEAVLSVDTFRATVAEAALDAGAHWVNDISGGEADGRMFDLVARRQATYVLMHMRGTPQTMTTLTEYDDLLHEILQYFQKKIAQLRALGQKDIILDVGFGFAKNPAQNFGLLGHLPYFEALGLPMLVGISRKSMIYKTLQTTPEASLNGTTVLNTIALLQNAAILRVHDVRQAVECIELVANLKQQTKKLNL
ncbi:MAG TPA: dihydropteroate synthase [Microscillaceae bacterium]|jgi:dihydropteroate synthase|nr:dihydropteroate synthase [Microscillaceae bacterium]